MTVGMLLDNMTYAEYTDWVSFFSMKDKGEEPDTDWDSMTPEQVRAKIGIV